VRRPLLLLLCCIGTALGQEAPASPALVLENAQLRVRLSARNAAVLEVHHKQRDVSYTIAASESWFRIQMPLPDWEGHALSGAPSQAMTARRIAPDSVEFAASRLTTSQGIYQVGVKLLFRLDGDNLVCRLSLQNHSQQVLDRITFPILAVPPASNSGELMLFPNLTWPLAFVFSQNEIRTERNPFDSLDLMDLKAWFYSDPRIAAKALDYPMSLPTGWAAYAADGKGIGFDIRDRQFQFKKFLIERRLQRDSRSRMANRRDYQLSWNWYPQVRPGESWETSDVYIKFGDADWHTYARQHRDWLRTWIGRPAVPERFKSSLGWMSRGIRSFDEIPRTAKQGVEVGAPYFIIYGWSTIGPQGMSYGAYPRTDWGGVQGLQRNLAEARKLGSYPIAWFNGTVSVETNLEHLSMGKDWIATDRWGGDIFDGRWSFFEPLQIVTLDNNDVWFNFDPSTGVRGYWLDTVRRMVQEYGFSGFEMDQGHKNYLSYRTGEPPNLAFTRGYGDFFVRAEKIVKGADPNGIIVGENTNEHMTQYVDATWIFEGGSLDVANQTRLRYSNPWTTVSARAVVTDRGQANQAFLLNAPLDIFDDLEKHPEYAEHLRKLHALKKATFSYFYDGEFSDNEGFSLEPAGGVLAMSYRDPGQKFTAVVIVNASADAKQAKITPDAASASTRLRHFYLSGVEETGKSTSEIPLSLAPYDVQILVFEK